MGEDKCGCHQHRMFRKHVALLHMGCGSVHDVTGCVVPTHTTHREEKGKLPRPVTPNTSPRSPIHSNTTRGNNTQHQLGRGGQRIEREREREIVKKTQGTNQTHTHICTLTHNTHTHTSTEGSGANMAAR
jgi:hypothetical protein